MILAECPRCGVLMDEEHGICGWCGTVALDPV